MTSKGYKFYRIKKQVQPFCIYSLTDSWRHSSLDFSMFIGTQVTGHSISVMQGKVLVPSPFRPVLTWFGKVKEGSFEFYDGKF